MRGHAESRARIGFLERREYAFEFWRHEGKLKQTIQGTMLNSGGRKSTVVFKYFAGKAYGASLLEGHA